MQLTSPRSQNGRSWTDVQTGSKVKEQCGRKSFGEDISILRRRRDTKNSNLTHSDFISHKVNIYLYMFCVLMLNRIGGQINGTDVITIHKCSRRRWVVKLAKQVMQPTSLSNSICNSPILSFSTGSRNGTLSLGRPREEVLTHKNTVTGSGATCGGATSPIGIRIGNKTTRRRYIQL